MKKILTILTVAGFIATSVNAQKSDASGLEYGAKAGVNFCTGTSSYGGKSTSESGTGIQVGGYVAIPIGNTIKIQPELLYDNQSTTADGSTTNLNYLSVPIMAKYAIQSSGFSVLAGPQIGLLLSAKAKTSGNSVDIKDQCNGTNFSLAIGGEYALPMGINFSARYIAGLSNISKADGYTYKISSFSITVGYAIGKSK